MYKNEKLELRRKEKMEMRPQNLSRRFVCCSRHLLFLTSSVFIISSFTFLILLTTADAKPKIKISPKEMGMFATELLANAITIKLIADKDPIAKMEIKELVEYYGYEIEEHKFYASDGYLATLHRLSRGRISNPNSKRGFPSLMPVLIQHGIFQTGIAFLHNEEKSLPFLLVDQGFDVFLSSSRGSSLSLGHKTIKVSSDAYWNFGLEEITSIEMPEFIDYILNLTQYPKLNYVGYSLGATIIALTLANKPEYNEKIERISVMGPALYFDHATSPLFTMFKALPAETVYKALVGGYTNGVMRTVIKEKAITPLCSISLGHTVCSSMFLLVLGAHYHHLNYTLLARSMSHSSIMAPRPLLQALEWKKARKLNHYDYGVKGNLLKYNQPTPPDYNLSNIRTPVQAFVSTEDIVTTPPDTLRALSELGPFFVNPETAVLKGSKFTHADYLVNAAAYKLVYRHIVEFLKTGKPSASAQED